MKIPLYQVDAFTSKIFNGNPAAVCPLEDWIDDDIMQKIAQENNLSETAFFVKNKSEFEIRWFTPLSELDLAGHPTLAAAHVILQELKFDINEVIFHTKIKDILKVNYKENLYVMDFPSRNPEIENNLEKVTDALGKRPKELYRHRDAVAVYENEEDIKFMSPNMEKIKKLDYANSNFIFNTHL